MPANVDNKAESKPKKSAVPDAIVIPAASTTSPKSPRPDIAAGLGIFSPRVSEDVKIAVQQEEEIKAQIDKDNAEEEEELKEVAAQEKLTQAKEDAPPMPGAMQAAKMQVMDKKEEAEELKKVEEADAVNEDSKAAPEDALADKMIAQKQLNKDAAEDAAELKEVEDGRSERGIKGRFSRGTCRQDCRPEAS